MALGMIGQKQGMTRIFTEDGKSIPVTVVKLYDTRVLSIKSKDTDGYDAVQITYGEANLKRLTKPMSGVYAKANVKPGKGIVEFAGQTDAEVELNIGDAIPLSTFSEGQKVDVQGVSKGKGFAGTVKRHNFRTQDASHGNSLSHRAPGSVGQTQTPGRVWKGKKMAGHMESQNTTIQSLELVKIDEENGTVAIKGAIPGHNDANVIITHAVKSK